jgi:hypothetical protein
MPTYDLGKYDIWITGSIGRWFWCYRVKGQRSWGSNYGPFRTEYEAYLDAMRNLKPPSLAGPAAEPQARPMVRRKRAAAGW